ncbi:MAG: hypothetical protein H7257_11755 [Taibaiella sp.]|nr:hypothetical protein [Taibaiella sp.]
MEENLYYVVPVLCLCGTVLIYDVYMWASKKHVGMTGTIVGSRRLTDKELKKANDNERMLLEIDFVIDSIKYNDTLMVNHIALPKINEEMSITVDVKKKKVIAESGNTYNSIIVNIMMITIIVCTLYKGCGKQ